MADRRSVVDYAQRCLGRVLVNTEIAPSYWLNVAIRIARVGHGTRLGCDLRSVIRRARHATTSEQAALSKARSLRRYAAARKRADGSADTQSTPKRYGWHLPLRGARTYRLQGARHPGCRGAR